MRIQKFTSTVLFFALTITTAQITNSNEKVNIVSFYGCESRELLVVLNKDNEAKKKEIIEGMKAISAYDDFIVTPVSTDDQELHFNLKPTNCHWVEPQPQEQQSQVEPQEPQEPYYSCDEPRSWGEIQWRLKTIKATEVTCDTHSKQEQQEAQEEEDDGGVTGDNGN